ncbi:MAG: carboxypeptidase-like regulatory domain-containing protein, partial [Bryobacterales bacterium]|nr:carboxypeptidase-like regulatory domain-containing protein [Bryobacterales bacterium]
MNAVKSSILTCFLLSGIPFLRGQDTAGVGAITGTVTGHDEAPATGVRVCVLTTTRCVVSDERGKFRLTEIRAGDYQLEISAQQLPPFNSAQVSVRAGLEAQIEIALPALDGAHESVTVSDSVFVAPEEVKTSSFLVERQEIFKSAGAQMDVSRYVQSLPGVGVGSSSMRNDLIVRGGSPLENLFIVDNIEIPNINTFANLASAGGLTSILDADLIRDVNFMSGGYPA